MRKRVLLWSVAAGCVLLTYSAVGARFVRSIWLERDVKECEVVAVGTVTGVQAKGTRQRALPRFLVDGKPYVEEVEVFSVSYSVEVAIKGKIRERDTDKFRQYRVAGKRIRRGSNYFSHKQGDTYLLFLKQRDDGAFEPIAPEWRPVTFGPETLKKLKALRPRDDLVAWIMDMLVVRLEAQRPGVGPVIRVLEGSPSFEKRAEDVAFRDRVVRALLPVTQRSKDSNDVIAAYQLLGKLGETSVIPGIVEYACRREMTREIKANTISWLGGFSAREQVKALEEIAAKAHDLMAVGRARSQLGQLRGRAADEEQRERMRKSSRPAPPRTLDDPLRERLARGVTMEFNNRTVKQVAAGVGQRTGLPVEVLGAPEGRVTLRLQDVPLGEALWWIGQLARVEIGLKGIRILMAEPGTLGKPAARFQSLLPPPSQDEKELKRIRAVLGRRVSFNLNRTSLDETIWFLQTLVGLNIVLDPSVVGDGAGRGITVRAEDLTVGRAIEEVARATKLDVGFVHGVIYLAAKDELERLRARPLAASSSKGRGSRGIAGSRRAAP